MSGHITIFIGETVVPLPRRHFAGMIYDETDADILDYIRHRRVIARLRRLMERGELAEHEVQAKAIELCNLPLAVYSPDDDFGEADPVAHEAMNIARDMIVTRMAQEGLPPPKGLDTHAKALVDAVPDIRERARLRVEERYKAASAAIGNLNHGG